MCKATEYSSQLLGIYDNINKDYNSITNELSRLDKYEQDLLHVIENGGFNACQGYKLAKMISDNRQERRTVKNEWITLQRLKDQFVDSNMKKLKNISINIEKQNENLIKATETRSYKLKVLKPTDIDGVAPKIKLG